MDKETPVIALVGNPNTGKSTVFNSLTGMRQHTGNWSGKTVGNAWAEVNMDGRRFILADLPGIYSLSPLSEDEKNAVELIKSNTALVYVVILDATCLERSLILAREVIKSVDKTVICLNLTDEAARKKIEVDAGMLSELLGVPVIPACGVKGEGLEELCRCVRKTAESRERNRRSELKSAAEIYGAAVRCGADIMNMTDRKIDRIVLSRRFGLPLVFALITVIFWITVSGANYPSRLLEMCFEKMTGLLYSLTDGVLPESLRGLLIGGVFTTMGCVVSVMLPPMAIFFPLFTLLEDLGYLPRMAFNLDCLMRGARAHSKMVLTMCMGFGCNAAGVTAARIIDSPRERLIAILTNCFVPCNGRFPTLILMISLFIAQGSLSAALVLSCTVLAALGITLAVSRWLSQTVLKGEASSSVLELPPYRRPQAGRIIVRSLLDRTVFILGRAVAAAAPAGALLWLLCSVDIGGVNILKHVTGILDPIGRAMGMDGCILTGFILGLPANETVIPITLMCYKGGGGLNDAADAMQIRELFVSNGWNLKTAVCVIIFSLCHFPCATTLMTIKKETGSLKWTAFAFLLPTAVGAVLCCAVNLLAAW